MLSSVGFNMETLTPTYHYLENSVGASNALEIASRYFDDASIIENARHYLEKNKSDHDELMDRLSRQIDELEAEKNRLSQERDVAQKLAQELDEKNRLFDSEKEKLKQKYIDELNDYLEDIRLEALEKLDSIQEKKDVAVVEEIEDLKKEKKIEKKKDHFEVGDNVRISDNEQVGTIISLSKDKATISIRGLTVKANISDLTLMPKMKKKEAKVTAARYRRMPSELNLVGQRVEDGLVMMEEYLDRANASHMSSVKIIHGIGTGILRKARRQRLAKLSYVKNFRDGDYYDGGSAVTIVEFK